MMHLKFLGSLLGEIVNLGFRRLLGSLQVLYIRRLPKKSFEPKIFNLIRFFSLYKENYAFNLFLSDGWNKNVKFLTLILSKLSLISLNLKTQNFINFSSFCIMYFSLLYIFFVGFSFLGRSINFGYVFLCVLYVRFKKAIDST